MKNQHKGSVGRLFPILPFAIILLCKGTFQVRIPCQFHSQTWQANNTLFLNERQMLVSTKYGFDMFVDRLDRTVSQSIALKGSWDPSQMHTIAKFLKPGFKVLNLGPQTGLQAILMGKLIGQQGKLFLFEPNPFSYSILKKNIYLNDLEQITSIFKLGASDVQMEQILFFQDQNTGAASILPQETLRMAVSGRHFQESAVQVDLVDNILYPQIKIDFVLMDVEKMQVEALLGMKRLIQKSQGMVMMVEWQYAVNPHRNQEKSIRCLKWLTSLGFHFYKYKENEMNKCEIGEFQRIESPLSLLQMGPLDVIIAPSHIDPSKFQ